MSQPEVVLWRSLRGGRLTGLRFRRQHPLGPWILDFYCAEHRLGVEIDGWGHNMGEPGRDERRDLDLARRGVRVVRFTAQDVASDLEMVLRGAAPSRPSAVLPHVVGEMRKERVWALQGSHDAACSAALAR